MSYYLTLLMLCLCCAAEPLQEALRRRSEALLMYAGGYPGPVAVAVPLHAPLPAVLHVLSPRPPTAAASHTRPVYARPGDSYQPYVAETYQRPYASETQQRPFASNAHHKIYASDTQQKPHISDAYQKPYASDAYQKPYASDAYQRPYTPDTYADYPRSYAPNFYPHVYAAEAQIHPYTSPISSYMPEESRPYAAENYARPYSTSSEILYARPDPYGGYTYYKKPSKNAPKKVNKKKTRPVILRIHKYRTIRDR